MTLAHTETATQLRSSRQVRGKVVIVGAGEAGKSTLIAALCHRALNLEVDGRTVAMDHGALNDDEVTLSLIGVPGQARFREIRQALTTGARSAVWVHRVGQPIDAETIDLLAECTVPYLVILNHDTSPATATWRQPDCLPAPEAILSANLAQLKTEEIEFLQREIRALVSNSPPWRTAG